MQPRALAERLRVAAGFVFAPAGAALIWWAVASFLEQFGVDLGSLARTAEVVKLVYVFAVPVSAFVFSFAKERGLTTLSCCIGTGVALAMTSCPLIFVTGALYGVSFSKIENLLHLLSIIIFGGLVGAVFWVIACWRNIEVAKRERWFGKRRSAAL